MILGAKTSLSRANTLQCPGVGDCVCVPVLALSTWVFLKLMADLLSCLPTPWPTYIIKGCSWGGKGSNSFWMLDQCLPIFVGYSASEIPIKSSLYLQTKGDKQQCTPWCMGRKDTTVLWTRKALCAPTILLGTMLGLYPGYWDLKA